MVSHLEIEETAARWLAQRDSGGWSDADEAELSHWLNSSTAHRVAFLRLEAAWEQADRLKALGAGATPGLIPNPGEWWQSPFFEPPPTTPVETATPLDLSTPPPARIGRIWLSHSRALAASLVIVAIVGGGSYFWPHGSVYRTDVGGLASVPLSDGSKVTLNTDSEIRVAVTETERRVTLDQGEAFFEVAKDPKRPFVVRAGEERVIAVGTKFSVRRDGDTVRVVVTEGRVRVERASPGGLIPVTQVSAGTIASAASTGTLVQKEPIVEAEESLSWRRGFLVFRDTSLGEAIIEFNRYNERKIVIEDPAIAALHVGGSIRSTNVEAFVRLIEQGFPVHAEVRGDQILLKAI